MTEWWSLGALFVAFVVSVYLIAKGIEVTLRGTKATNPNRVIDLIVGTLLLVPGILIAVFGWFWILPRLTT